MRSLTLKNWFLLASISCGVGFGSSFLISRNLQQSAWVGLGTVPSVAASLTILSRQRKEEIERAVRDSHRQVAELTSSLATELAQIEARRQFAIDSARQSDLKLQSIHTRIHQYSAAKKQLELQISTLQSQGNRLQSDIAEKKVDLTKIGQQISPLEDRRNRLSTVVGDLDRSIQVKQAFLRDIEVRKQSTIDSAQKLDLELQKILSEISQQSAVKDRLGFEIANLKHQWQRLQDEIAEKKVYRTEIEEKISSDEDLRNRLSIAVDGLHQSIQKRQDLLQELGRNISSQTTLLSQIEVKSQSAIDSAQQSDLGRKTTLELEIASLLLQKDEHQASLANLARVIHDSQASVSQLDTSFISKQEQLDRIINELTEIEAIRQSTIDSAAQLDLESQRIQARIHQHSATKEELGVEVARAQYQWSSLQSQITEREAYRTELERQIARLEEALNRNTSLVEDRDRDFPVSTKSEQLVSWEDHLIADSELLKIEPDILELKEQIKSDCFATDEAQSNDNTIERYILNFPMCIFCQRSPMPGNDRCRDCN